MNYIILDPSVSDSDQNHAAALQELRASTDGYVLLLPDAAGIRIFGTGSTEWLMHAALALQKATLDSIELQLGGTAE